MTVPAYVFVEVICPFPLRRSAQICASMLRFGRGGEAKSSIDFPSQLVGSVFIVLFRISMVSLAKLRAWPLEMACKAAVVACEEATSFDATLPCNMSSSQDLFLRAFKHNFKLQKSSRNKSYNSKHRNRTPIFQSAPLELDHINPVVFNSFSSTPPPSTISTPVSDSSTASITPHPRPTSSAISTPHTTSSAVMMHNCCWPSSIAVAPSSPSN